MNCKAILTTAAAGAVLSVFSAVPAPEVSVSGMSQDSKGVATISYNLSAADAVVTLDIETNATGNVWASIGGAAVSSAQGDVWKKVEIGTHTIKWDGASCWADHKIPANGVRAVVTAWALDNTPDYMVVDLTSTGGAGTEKYYPSADFLPGGLLDNDDYRTTSLVMRKIMAKGVEWTMGSTTMESSWNRTTAENTHKVTLTNNYYIGVFEITQGQWSQIATNSGVLAACYFKDTKKPVDAASYNECRNTFSTSTTHDKSNLVAANADYNWPNPPNPSSFIGLLRSKTGIGDFDLPSEAEWEFACRAGNGDGRLGDGSALTTDNLYKLGRCSNNVSSRPDLPQSGSAPVGSYAPNSWGLYDMHGNVTEWCLDWYQTTITDFDGRVNIDPEDASKTRSSATGSVRVRRGGVYSMNYKYCRSASRTCEGSSYNGTNPANRWTGQGLRVVCRAGLK